MRDDPVLVLLDGNSAQRLSIEGDCDEIAEPLAAATREGRRPPIKSLTLIHPLARLPGYVASSRNSLLLSRIASRSASLCQRASTRSLAAGSEWGTLTAGCTKPPVTARIAFLGSGALFGTSPPTSSRACRLRASSSSRSLWTSFSRRFTTFPSLPCRRNDDPLRVCLSMRTSPRCPCSGKSLHVNCPNQNSPRSDSGRFSAFLHGSVDRLDRRCVPRRHENLQPSRIV